jgi:galactokinase
MPSFREIFGDDPEIQESAPGRVNLIGEHTDYHHGFVLPTPIPQRTVVELTRRADRQVVAWTTISPDEVVEYELGNEARRDGWIDYVQGLTWALRDVSGLHGFDVRIDSAIPPGGGLASSAALEVAVLRAIRSGFSLPFDDLELARVAHRAETDFVGAPVGLMDQLVCSVGRAEEAVFIDTGTVAFERVAIPRDMELIVLDSGIRHQHAGGEYATRRRESFEAAERLGVAYLSDLSADDLPRIDALPSPLDKRARHVVTENARVRSAVRALEAGMSSALGVLLNASHRSLRDDYEVSTPEIDALVDIAQRDSRIYGARLTGGGFGGCIVALADAGAGAGASARILGDYRAQTGRTGARVLPLLRG